MDVVSLFSGCGGTDLGFEDAGHQVIWANDIDVHACDSYQSYFGLRPEQGDIRSVVEFPKADILVGCYPCQGFSFYGNRQKDDPRNFLFKQFTRALHQIKPKYFMAENVKGLNYGYGQVFLKQMLEEFTGEGYHPVCKLVNAKWYGVPQDRERVIIIGVRKDLNKKYEFPEPTHGKDKKPYKTMRNTIGDFAPPREDEVFQASYSSHYMSRNRKRSWDEVSFTIQASGRHAPLHPSGEPMQFVKKDEFRFGKGPNRRLSYRECAAIQTFPRKFKFEGRLGTKYQQIGNAVPPLLSKFFAESISSL